MLLRLAQARRADGDVSDRRERLEGLHPRRALDLPARACLLPRRHVGRRFRRRGPDDSRGLGRPAPARVRRRARRPGRPRRRRIHPPGAREDRGGGRGLLLARRRAGRARAPCRRGRSATCCKDTLTPETLETGRARRVERRRRDDARDPRHLLRGISRVSREVLEPRGLSLSWLTDREQEVLRLVAAGPPDARGRAEALLHRADDQERDPRRGHEARTPAPARRRSRTPSATA